MCYDMTKFIQFPRWLIVGGGVDGVELHGGAEVFHF